MADSKIWANSGDSHLVEPPNLFADLPSDIAERMPKSEKFDGYEIITVDGQQFRREMMTRSDGKPANSDPLAGNTARPEDSSAEELRDRIIGANDSQRRLVDCDNEGVWAEVIYPSLGIWAFNIKTPKVASACAQAMNDWAIDFQKQSPRYVCTASVPLVDVADTVAEIKRAAALGFMAIFLPVQPPIGRPDWNDAEWDPMWDAMEQNAMVVAYHIGTEPHDPTKRTGVYYRGRGGAVLNYNETTFGGQRAVAKMIGAGVFDRNPSLKVLVSEGGATWGPFLADRLDEGYRQHGAGVRPKLKRLPSEYIYENIYASFQHDKSAVKACTAMGWQNVMWGSDYPHFEGTFGHTQETLHELFDGVDEKASHRIRIGAFQELFPAVPLPPVND